MNIEVSDEVGLHLKQLAKERNLTIEELISAMLDQYDIIRNSKALAELAENAAKANLTKLESLGVCPPSIVSIAGS